MILISRRGSAARPRTVAIPAVAGSAGGGRLGDGTFSITPPAGIEWLAWSTGWGEPSTFTPPTNWTLVGHTDDGGQRSSLWRSTSSPGTTWTTAGIGDSNLPTVVRIVGYDRALTGVDPHSTVSGASPATTATGPCLVVRAGTSFNGSNTDAPYPTSATLGRSQSRQWSAGYGFGAVTAVAHENMSTAGAVASAAWSFAGTPDWVGHTVLLYG